MAQMTDDWTKVESWFAQLDQLPAWRSTVAAMRRLMAEIRADPRFHDLDPSTSHANLVFRRDAERAVFVSWNDDDDTYTVAFIDRPFDLRDRRRVTADRVIDVLLEYLEQHPS